MRQIQESPTECYIDGKMYIDKPGAQRLERILRPGENTPRDAHVSIPHHDREMRKLGVRVAIIFLALIAGIFLLTI